MNHERAYGALYGGAPPHAVESPPLIINVSLTGNLPTKATNPHVPVSVEEIVDDAAAVLEAGATMLHIHARDGNGVPTWHPDVYGRIFERIRKHYPDAILVATTSGRLHSDLIKRSAVLELDGDARPDMASLTLGSLNFPTQPSINAPDTIQQLCERMRARGITPELEAFDLGMVNYAFYLQRKGWLPHTCYINLLLGSLGTIPGRVGDLCQLVREIPRNWVWAAAGIGHYQLLMNNAGLLLGGHVRVGLEDNPYYNYARRETATNLALVQRVLRLAGELGRPAATRAQARAMLRLGEDENWAATQVGIRKMQPDDMAVVMALLAKWNMAPLQANETVPNPERDHVEIGNTFVAVLQGKVVGVASYLPIDAIRAETASLAVAPEFIGCGIGYRLQQARLEEMRLRGFVHVRTEADRPDVIRWYVDKFGYRMVGKNPKKHAFSLKEYSHWTVLELELR